MDREYKEETVRNMDLSQQQAANEPMERRRFNFKNITPEEKNIIKSLQRESSYYRGYPLALIAGGLTHLGLKRKFPSMNNIGRFSLILFAGVAGNATGKLSYLPTIMKRLNDELPENSELRGVFKMPKDEYRKATEGLSQPLNEKQNFYNYNPPQRNEQAEESQDVGNESEKANSVAVSKKWRTYEDLRNTYRDEEKSGTSSRMMGSREFPLIPMQSERLDKEIPDSYGEIPTQTKKKVRYNKYGDPILE